jgi:hypothetical protein
MFEQLPSPVWPIAHADHAAEWLPVCTFCQSCTYTCFFVMRYNEQSSGGACSTRPAHVVTRAGVRLALCALPSRHPRVSIRATQNEHDRLVDLHKTCKRKLSRCIECLAWLTQPLRGSCAAGSSHTMPQHGHRRTARTRTLWPGYDPRLCALAKELPEVLLSRKDCRQALVCELEISVPLWGRSRQQAPVLWHLLRARAVQRSLCKGICRSGCCLRLQAYFGCVRMGPWRCASCLGMAWQACPCVCCACAGVPLALGLAILPDGSPILDLCVCLLTWSCLACRQMRAAS